MNDWRPPKDYGRRVTSNAKHLRNLYVYFWRWAAWKVFEQGAGGRDKVPPSAEQLAGMVCYITVSGFLNGSGFQKMRADLRRDCDEIWVIDCSPEGHQPEVNTRIFQGVQHAVCIVVASRSPDTKPDVPARVRYRSLKPGRRAAKFAELSGLTLASPGWVDCPPEPRAPFLPAFTGGWADFTALDCVIDDAGLGTMAGRTWIIAPDRRSLERRWSALLAEPDKKLRATLFFPHGSGGPTVEKAGKSLPGRHAALPSIETGFAARGKADQASIDQAASALTMQPPIRYGLRSFDRQWIIPDKRLINRHNPDLWSWHGAGQVYLTALSELAPRGGPGVTLSANIPDHDHYSNRGGRVFPLWRNAAATQTNVSPDVLAALTKVHGAAPDPADVFAYVAALLAHPAYTEAFRADLVRPGLRVPLTADAALFAEAAAVGREVIWLHSFGERFAEGHPAGPPRLPEEERPRVITGHGIPATPGGFPDTIGFDAIAEQLKVGTGRIGPVAKAVWDYEVSGKQVLTQWFSYRKKNRERPIIGDRRKPSPLGDIQPEHWLPEYTEELLNVLNILGLVVDLEPLQADLLQRVVDGPLVTPAKLAS